jgi:hypothetical protein
MFAEDHLTAQETLGPPGGDQAPAAQTCCHTVQAVLAEQKSTIR